MSGRARSTSLLVGCRSWVGEQPANRHATSASNHPPQRCSLMSPLLSHPVGPVPSCKYQLGSSEVLAEAYRRSQSTRCPGLCSVTLEQHLNQLRCLPEADHSMGIGPES